MPNFLLEKKEKVLCIHLSHRPSFSKTIDLRPKFLRIGNPEHKIRAAYGKASAALLARHQKEVRARTVVTIRYQVKL
jgi:hypothetical protein